jgi:nicotinamidase/pyrazinamidase
MPSAVVFVDPQNDFCAKGALAVEDGDAIMPVLNRMRTVLKPSRVVVTQDWHPANHTSFIDNNPGETLFGLRADGQVMWPKHCVQGSAGAEFHPAFERRLDDILVQKGTLANVDSYSGFGAENKSKENTRLDEILDACCIDYLFIGGLAFDYCVAATAKDAASLGFNVTVVREATRAVSPVTAAKEEAAFQDAGVKIVETVDDILWSWGV